MMKVDRDNGGISAVSVSARCDRCGWESDKIYAKDGESLYELVARAQPVTIEHAKHCPVNSVSEPG